MALPSLGAGRQVSKPPGGGGGFNPLSLLMGPASFFPGGALPGIGPSNATSGAVSDGTQYSILSSPFIFGNDNATGDAPAAAKALTNGVAQVVQEVPWLALALIGATAFVAVAWLRR